MADEEKKQKPVRINRTQTVSHIAGSQIKADHKFTLGQTDTKVFSAKFNHDDTYVAAGWGFLLSDGVGHDQHLQHEDGAAGLLQRPK